MTLPPELVTLLNSLRPYLHNPAMLVVFVALWIVLSRVVPGGRVVRVAGGFLLALLGTEVITRLTGGVPPVF